jgi:hypothetical protein
MCNHSAFFSRLPVMDDMFILMGRDSCRCLFRRKVRRCLERNGWIIRPIHIFPVLSGFALAGGQIGLAGQVSSIDPALNARLKSGWISI